MAEETYSFDMARVRLEEIAAQVRKKDISLEKSLDLLEEGVRLANLCTEQIDQTQWRSVIEEAEPEGGAKPETDSAAGDGAGAENVAEAASGDETLAGSPCEEAPEGAAALFADEDAPAEDSHGVGEQAPSEDPDVEA